MLWDERHGAAARVPFAGNRFKRFSEPIQKTPPEPVFGNTPPRRDRMLGRPPEAKDWRSKATLRAGWVRRDVSG